MTSDELANALFSLKGSPDNILVLAEKRDGGYVGFEPAAVMEREGMAIITLNPVELSCDSCSTKDCVSDFAEIDSEKFSC